MAIQWQNPVFYRLVWKPNPRLQQQMQALCRVVEAPETCTANLPESRLVFARFTATEADAEPVIRWMQKELGNCKAFPVMLNNVSGQPPHSIFWRVQYSQHVGFFRQRLQQLSQQFIFHNRPVLLQPGKWVLPLLEGVSGMDYDNLLYRLARQELTETVTVHELWLEADSLNGEGWQRVHFFRLLPDNQLFQQQTACRSEMGFCYW